MRVDEAREGLSCRLAMGCFRQEIIILGKQHTAQITGTVQQRRVVQRLRAILLCR